MKTQFALIFCLVLNSSFAQNSLFIEGNDVKARVSDYGSLFFDQANGIANYFVPKNDITATIYFAGRIILGKDSMGNLIGALSSYNSSDFAPGPIATNYSDPNYTSNYGNSLWPISKVEINNHIANLGNTNYVVPLSIQNWPANGNTSNGIAAQLAPFFDSNSNGIYEPQLGEYPKIRGDFAIYTIYNDDRFFHTFSGLEKMSIEIHQMLYQFIDTTTLNQTTFIHSQVFNRSNEKYFGFQTGMHVDFDLGNFADDFMGSSSSRNLAFCYNSDLFDQDNGQSIGFGANPPACGIIDLNNDLYAHMLLSQISSSAINNNMNGLLSNGTIVYDNNGNPTRYIYNEGDSTELQRVNAGGDRQSVISTSPIDLAPNASICSDYAIVYARSSEAQIEASVNKLKTVADQIQNFYDSNFFTCETPVLAITEKTTFELSFSPNPSSESILFPAETNGIYTVYDLNGKIVLTGELKQASISIKAIPNGIYTVQLYTKNGSIGRAKLVKI